jgi:hypothetical protein
MRNVGSREMIGWLAAVLLLAIPQTDARAATIVLDFEGLRDLEQVLNFYNGGTGSFGSSGTNYGIGFSNGALAIIDADAGGSGNFANEPSADTIAFFLSAPSLTMNVASGFTTGFSFYYSSSVQTAINVYDGLNGTGNLLASVLLAAQGTASNGCQLPGDPTGVFNCWNAAGVNFAGTAMSVNFGGAANLTGFDNITLGSATPVIPEPSSTALFLLGFSIVGSKLRRRAC